MSPLVSQPFPTTALWRRHAQTVRDSSSSYKKNSISDSKVTTILLKGDLAYWWSCIGMSVRMQPAQQTCFVITLIFCWHLHIKLNSTGGLLRKKLKKKYFPRVFCLPMTNLLISSILTTIKQTNGLVRVAIKVLWCLSSFSLTNFFSNSKLCVDHYKIEKLFPLSNLSPFLVLFWVQK